VDAGSSNDQFILQRSNAGSYNASWYLGNYAGGLAINNATVATTPKFLINSSGNIGIGSTDPGAYKLSVNGSINGTTVYQNGYQVCDTSGNCPNGGGGGSITGSGTSGYITKFTGTYGIGNAVMFESAGNLGIGTTIPSALFEVNGTSWLRGGTAPISGLYVNESGNVGIGTTAPGTYALNVNGAAGEILLLHLIQEVLHLLLSE